MANALSPSGRTGSRRRCTTITRVDLLTLFLAAMLCSASYCLGIWHNNRGAADSRVLGPSAVLAGAKSCGDDASADEEPLDFEARHSAEGAGLSVSMSSAASTTVTGTRRALRGAAPGSTGYRDAVQRQAIRGVVWAGKSSAPGAAEAATGKSWTARFDGDNLRLTDAGVIRA